MVTKAIVDDVSDKYEIKVRVPMLDRTSLDPRYVTGEYLPSAPICTLPNTGLNLRKGDIVWVAFENGDPSRPVIVGCLYTDKLSETEPSMVLNSLSVSANAELPEDTSIGDITSEELQRLKGVNDNVQAQIEALKTSVEYKSTIYAHKVRFNVDGIGITAYVNLLTNSDTELTVSDFIDSSEHGVPSTIDRITNAWGTMKPDHGNTYLGVPIMFSITYSNSAGDWRALRMSVCSISGEVDTTELQQSDISYFSDTVTRL